MLDTSYILGRGAVKDTYNLLGDGIKKLVQALAATTGHKKPEVFSDEHGLHRYFGSSLKGQASIDGTTLRREERSWEASSPRPTSCWR